MISLVELRFIDICSLRVQRNLHQSFPFTVKETGPADESDLAKVTQQIVAEIKLSLYIGQENKVAYDPCEGLGWHDFQQCLSS